MFGLGKICNYITGWVGPCEIGRNQANVMAICARDELEYGYGLVWV
jgi:hypothetical protein